MACHDYLVLSLQTQNNLYIFIIGDAKLDSAHNRFFASPRAYKDKASFCILFHRLKGYEENIFFALFDYIYVSAHA